MSSDTALQRVVDIIDYHEPCCTCCDGDQEYDDMRRRIFAVAAAEGVAPRDVEPTEVFYAEVSIGPGNDFAPPFTSYSWREMHPMVGVDPAIKELTPGMEGWYDDRARIEARSTSKDAVRAAVLRRGEEVAARYGWEFGATTDADASATAPRADQAQP